MQINNLATGISFWLKHLHALYPPKNVTVVGSAMSVWPELLDKLAIKNVLLIDADSQKFKSLQELLARNENWRVVEYLLGEREETANYYLLSNPSENGLVKPEWIKALWPNITARAIEERLTGCLDTLLKNIDHSRSQNWLVVDSLSALSILTGAENSLPSFEVVIARTVHGIVEDIPDNLCKQKIDTWMEAHGYRYVAHESERHPKVVKAIYVRDRNGMELLQVERDELKQQIVGQKFQIERLSDEKRNFEKNADAHQQQLGELEKKLSPPQNPYGHNRILTLELNCALREFAKSALGLDGLKPAYIDYVAGRSLHFEKSCVGRLATTVQDVVARQLIAQCLKSNELNVLEIGALYGVNLAIIYNHTATRFDMVTVTCLDPFDGYYGQAFDPHLGIPVNDSTFVRNMDISHVPNSNYRIIKKYSTDPEALTMVQDLAVNLLIIDGDHSYAGVKFDFEAYFKLLAPGGYIIFDDYNAKEWPGVQKFVDEEIRNNMDCEFLGSISRTAVVRKKLPR